MTDVDVDIQVTDAYEGEDIVLTLTVSQALGNIAAKFRTFVVATSVPTSADVTTCITNGRGCASGSTPAAASDFTDTDTNVVFGPTDTVKTLSIPTATDSTNEGTEVVEIKIEVLGNSENTPYGGGGVVTGRVGFRSVNESLVFPTYSLLYTFGQIRDGARPAPAKPTGFTATPGNGQVALSWTDPGDDEITGWQIRFKVGAGSYTAWGDLADSDADTTSFTAINLTNGTEYAFQVRARSRDTFGPPSDERTATPTTDTTAPTVSSIERHSPTAQTTNGRTLTWRVTFSEAVRNVDAADFQVSQSNVVVITFPLTTLSVSEHGSGGTTWDVTATMDAGLTYNGGAYLLFAGGHNIQDTAGNALAASPSVSGTNEDGFLVYHSRPRIDEIKRQTPSTSPTDADSLTWRVAFARKVVNVSSADFTVTGTTATVTDVSEHGSHGDTYDVTVSGGDLANLEGTVTLGFASGQDIEDEAGNRLTNLAPQHDNDNTFVIKNIDPLAPRVQSIVRHSPATASAVSAQSLSWRVTFDRPVMHVYYSDFRLAYSGFTPSDDDLARINLHHLRTVPSRPAVPPGRAREASPARPGGTTVLLVTASRSDGDFTTSSGTVTLELAPGHNARDEQGRKLPNLDPVGGGADERTFTLDSTKTNVSFGRAAYRVTEGEDAVVTVRLSKLRATATQVRVSATPLTATGLGVDYHGQTYTATIPAYRLSGTLRIGTVKDSRKEGDERFRLDIAPGLLPSGVILAAPDGADASSMHTYVTISDPPPPLSETPRLVFDTTRLVWDEADGCGAAQEGWDGGLYRWTVAGHDGPTYRVKLGTRPPNDVTVLVQDPNDLEYPSVRGATLRRVSVEDNEVGWKGRYLTFERDAWDVWQTVQVKVACTHHNTRPVPIVNSVSGVPPVLRNGVYTRDTYPGAMGKHWTVHVDVLESNPPIEVKDLPRRGEPVTVEDGGTRDFRIRVNESILPAGSGGSVTIELATVRGPVRVARRDGRAVGNSAYYSDYMRFTDSTREQWVRLSDSGCGRRDCDHEEGRLEVVVRGMEWKMTWPVTVVPDGLGSEDSAVPVPDTAVSSLQVTAVDATSASAAWDAVPHATSYDVSWEALPDDPQGGAFSDFERVSGTSATIRHDATEPMTLTVTVTPEYIDGDGVIQRLYDLAATATLAVGPGAGDGTGTDDSVGADTEAARAAAVAACVSDDLKATTERYYDLNSGKAPKYGRNWFRVMVAFGMRTPGQWPRGGDAAPYTAAEARTSQGVWNGWKPFAKALECIETEMASQPEQAQEPETVPVPEVTVSGGGGVTEGASASFTVTANPAPASPLQVTLTVSQGGDFAAAGETGTRTVTVPAGGSVGVDIPTVDDGQDEPDGSVTVTVDPGTGYTVGGSAAHTVAVADNDAAALPELSLSAGAAVDEGGNASFTVTASPAPQSDITIGYTVAQGGAVLAAPGAGQRTVTLAAGNASVTLAVATEDDGVDEADGSVSVTLDAGTGYTVAAGAGGASVAVRDNDEPVVGISAGAAVTEGAAASFTVTASPVPHAPLEVALTVSQDGDFAASGETGAKTVTVPVGGSVTLEVPTVNDEKDEPDGLVTATLDAGTGYTVAAAPANAASVEVRDDDAAAGAPTISIADASFEEGAYWGAFTVRLSRPVAYTVGFSYFTRESTPVSARAGEDFFAYQRSWRIWHRFAPGETEVQINARLLNDSHDEDPETFEMVLFDAVAVNGPPGASVSIADGVAVGTIVNDDPMPAAWLARFGRTAAEAALDGIAGRMAAPRTAGVQGTIAGQALNLDPGSQSGAANDPGSLSGAGAAPGNPSGSLSLAQSSVARAFGAGNGGFNTGSHDTFGFGTAEPHSRSMTARDALLGSSFTATGETDGTGGSLAFWGRAAQSSFDGREGTFSLDGETTTAMLGADYARGDWLLGLALMQSEGDGGYTDSGTGPQACPDLGDGMDAGMRASVCNGAVREGDGDVEASLTAAIPYAALEASERLKLWGALGAGAGEVTLEPEVGGSYKADIAWTMAALGLRGDVIAPPAEGSGLALAVTSDALWARTSSDRTYDLAASDSDVTRLRIGLEGSYRIALEEGGSVTPKLEVGARHDGGDAETGAGLELGGGIAWVDPRIGLNLDLSGRTLVAHGSDDLEDRGFAASLAWDPDPATQRGPSLTLTQDWGGQAQGGLDALFRTDPLSDRAGGGEATARWQAEAAWGFPAFSGRFTGSPHVGLGLATGARDYSLGWRLTPAANANAPDLSFGVKATRRENDGAEPEHTVGFEAVARW